MKEFTLGAKVAHPIHGAGTITRMELKEVGGRQSTYYIIDLLMKDMRLMIPVDRVHDCGLRGVVSRSTAAKIVQIISSPPSVPIRKWNSRYQENWGKIKTGDIHKVAEVWRDLAWRNKLKGLSVIERRMFREVQDLLTSELTFALNITKLEAEMLLQEIYTKKVNPTQEISGNTHV